MGVNDNRGRHNKNNKRHWVQHQGDTLKLVTEWENLHSSKKAMYKHFQHFCEEQKACNKS